MPRDGARRRGHQRLHRRLLRRDGGRLRRRRATWSRECRFKNSFIFKYSPRPGTKAAELYADDVPEDVEAAPQQRPAGDPERRSARRTTSRSSAARSRCWSKARARPAEAADDDRRPRRDCSSPAARMCDRIVVFDGNRRQIGQTPARRRSTTPTPTRCSARSSPSTSGPSCSRSASDR